MLSWHDCPFFCFLIFVYNTDVPSDWHKEDKSVHLIIVGPEVWVNASLYVIIFYLYNILICFQYFKKASNTLPFFNIILFKEVFLALLGCPKLKRRLNGHSDCMYVCYCNFKKHHQGIQTRKVMKCPSNYTPQEYKNRNLILTLEILDISERYSRNQSNLWYLCTVVILMNGGLTRVSVPKV